MARRCIWELFPGAVQSQRRTHVCSYRRIIHELCCLRGIAPQSLHNQPHRLPWPIQDKTATVLHAASLPLRQSCSHSGGRGMQTRSMPCRVLAGHRVLIKVFADNIPPSSASSLSLSFARFADSVFLSGSHSLFLCLPVSLAVVHLIMVLVCSCRAWHPN